MKLAKITKRALACGLAFALVVTGTGIQPGTTSAAKKKKAKSSQTKVSVTVGKTKTLKVKKATKKVKWSTSNKKVVKITKSKGKKKSSAVIKGVKKGSAVITAKYGKKKQQWKVTVKAPVTNIASISVDPLDPQCLVVKLKKAAAVNVSDITIALKNYNEGKYNYEPTVKTLTTTDQITYRIYLSSGIYNGRFVKLTLGKNDSKEVQFKKKIVGDENVNILKEKDSTFSIYCSEYFSNTIGNVKYTIKEGNLPEGVVINSKRGLIKGIATVNGTYPVTLQATDELGRTATATVNFIIYDKTVVVCPNSEQEVRLDDYVETRLADTATNKAGETYYKAFTISPKGGSGSYRYTLAAPDIANVRLSTDVKDATTGQVTQVAGSSTKLYIPFEITEGDHVYTITITDEVNPQITATTAVTVKAVKYYNIKGNAKDVNGAPLTGNALYFIPANAESFSEYINGYTYYKKDTTGTVAYDYDYDYDDGFEGDSYYRLYKMYRTASVGSSSTDTTIGKQKGTYSAELPAGQYIVKVDSEADGIYYQMSDLVTVGTADAMQDVVAPVRFFSVSGIATYANGSPVTEQYIYFETKDEQYEGDSDMNFSVKTDKTGAFIASLPANNYVAYILDEKGQRKYFTSDVAVADADVTLQGFALPISRYTVSGTVNNGTDGTTPLKNTTLKFINPEGDSISVETDATGLFKVALSGAAAPGITYTIKAYINGAYRTVGTVVVAEADIPAVNLVYSFANEVKDATAVSLDSDLALTSNGNNDMFAKLDVTESGSYQVRVNATAPISEFAFYVYDSNGQIEYSGYNDYSSYVSGTPYLSKGTYYIQIVPKSNNAQVSGTFTLKVTKSTYSYDEDYTTPSPATPSPATPAPAED